MINLDYNTLPLESLGPTVLTIGNFDGVHRGHQELIRTIVHESKNPKLTSVILTFYPHPVTYFLPKEKIHVICSRNYKEKLIAKLGVDAILTLSFDEKLANLTPEEYVKQILIDKLNVNTIWVGYDFTFGKNRKGNVRSLIEIGEKSGFKTRILSPQRDHDIVISSTKIRELLLEGSVDEANHYLNRVHIISGLIVSGDAKGRILGYPTINVNVKEGLIPGHGIYSGVVEIESEMYPTAIYIGRRPTFQDSDLRVEAHIIGFQGNLYHTDISIGFLNYLRPDTKFDNEHQLIKAIEKDCSNTQTDFDLWQSRPDSPSFIP